MNNPILKKAQVEQHLKRVRDVSKTKLTDTDALDFQISLNIITNGRKQTKNDVLSAFENMIKYLSNAPEDWLFQPSLLIQSSDLAGSSIQEELNRQDKAADSLILPGQAKSQKPVKSLKAAK